MTRLLAILIFVTGCGAGTKHKVDVAKTGTVQCVKADAGPLLTLTGELLAAAAASVLKVGEVSWPELVDKALARGRELGGCAFAAIYDAFEKAPETTARSLAITEEPRRAALGKLRDAFGGAQWQLADGTVIQ